MKKIDLIAVPSALGAPDTGVSQGPAALRQAGLLTTLQDNGLEADWADTIAPQPLPADATETQRWDALTDLCQRLTQAVGHSRQQDHFPLVIGGDHSIAAGTWPGVAASVDGPLGLLWLDAHLDAHTREDSASANPHGMPVALLIGDGDPRLAHTTLSPRHICLVGARSSELPERVRLERFGVKVFDQADIARRGLQAVLAEALTIVSTGTAGFGVSVDIDVLDPTEAASVNSPAPGGEPVDIWLTELQGIAQRPDCLALEIVECDGARSEAAATARLACQLLAALLGPEKLNWGNRDQVPAASVSPSKPVLSLAKGLS